MVAITKNERSWAISLITDINLIVAKRTWNIKRAGGETTINTGKKRMFPDVILYGDNKQLKILQGWEIKMPDVLITDNDFVKDAQNKATILGLNSCFIWNFTYGVLYVKDVSGNFNIVKTWDATKYIKTRQDVETYHNEWLLLIEQILTEINAYFESGVFHSAGLGEILSDTVMTSIITKNKCIVASEIKSEAVKSVIIRSYVSNWWEEVKVEYMSDETDMYEAYAKTILLNWLNKFMFAHIIKKYHNPAYAVESIDYSVKPQRAIEIFSEITAKCDFYNIFKTFDYSELIPSDVWDDIIEFNRFLSSNGIVNIDQNALQTTIENTVNCAKREVIGLYTTPVKLAELLVKLTINDLNEVNLDPCSGTGTIPKAILNYKKQFVSINKAYETTWASDKYSFPLQILNMGLTDASSINIPSMIFQANVFDLNVGQDVQIINPTTGKMITYNLPQLDSIISNLPFVNFNKKKEETNAVIQAVVKNIKDTTNINVSGRTDLYIYIIISVWKLLKAGGKLSVITSNSWLGTAAGKHFFDIVRWYYDIDSVYVSGKGKWFTNADVVTTLILMTKKEQVSEPIKGGDTTFGIINKTLADLEDADLFTNLINSAVLAKETDKNVLQLKKYKQSVIQEMLKMNVSINTLFHDTDWLLDIKDSLCKLGSLFKVFRGEKTGQDEIFYLKDATLVDAEFIRRGLKNTKSCNRLTAKSDTDVLCCDKTVEELVRLHHTKTLNWLARFENHLNQSVLTRGTKWNMLDATKLPYLFTGMNPEERIFFGKFDVPTFINQRLIGLLARSEAVDIDLCHTLLNSMLGMFYVEAVGFGRGLGVLDFSKDNLEKGYMLDPNLLSKEQRTNIFEAFKPLLERNILTTKEELLQADRLNFERIVLKAYGIDAYFDRIKASLLSIQAVRLSVKVKSK
ncbi:Eco57I restriction-modification methylase domain-containing protein [uncultured Clostridium sp.]|uniref:Eco57I restriction-modification methylase domain-containing protein n=1 Tax=uncultured Clostridium sp. TaxID=59620 RepID=UPI00260A6E1A|nr:N-6 DNA methylase [uncultured Clostridium sp.]